MLFCFNFFFSRRLGAAGSIRSLQGKEPRFIVQHLQIKKLFAGGSALPKQAGIYGGIDRATSDSTREPRPRETRESESRNNSRSRKGRVSLVNGSRRNEWNWIIGRRDFKTFDYSQKCLNSRKLIHSSPEMKISPSDRFSQRTYVSLYVLFFSIKRWRETLGADDPPESN